MSKNHDNRSAGAEADEDQYADRRSSCRYPVSEVSAWLGWWEAAEEGEDQGANSVETEATADVGARAKVFDASTYSAIMARGPAFRGSGTQQSAAKRTQAAMSVHPNGKAALPAVAERKAGPPAVASITAAQPAVREKTEARRESQAAGEAKMQSCRALILDLSHTGMSLLSEAEPQDGHSIWVRLDDSQSGEWVEASLRGVSPAEQGRFLVRLSFRDACPYDFFKVAVYKRSEK